MVIRLANEGDASQLAELNQEFNFSNAGSDDIAAYLANCLEYDKTVVADIDGVIAGFACVQVHQSWCYVEPWAELTELYIKPEYRRQGLAQAMIEFAEKVAREAGATDMLLLTNDANSAAKSLYQSCGYDSDPKLLYRKELPTTY